MRKIALQQMAFQAVWLACALGGAAGRALPGVLAATAFIAIHLATAQSRIREIVLVATGIALGWTLDLVLVPGSLVTYPGSPIAFGASPGWMLALWGAFALTVPVSFAWLRDRLLLAAGVGGIGGVVAYSAGAAMGSLAVGATAGWVVIAFGWALAMPALIIVSKLDTRASSEVEGGRFLV